MFLSIAILILVLMPTGAHAWGPMTHMQLGLEMFEYLALLSPAIRELIRKHPYDFLYGNVGADITIGKSFVEYRHHCHNWVVGLELLNGAHRSQQKAFAYGYLAHLAADTVAHNDFVPRHAMKHFKRIANMHISFEMRYDYMVEADNWPLLKSIPDLADKGDDLLLKNTLERTLFSFGTNRRLFKSFLLFHRMTKWRKRVISASGKHKLDISREEHRRYWKLSRGAMIDFLRRADKARCFRLDPAGISALSNARMMRKMLRSLERSNGMMLRRKKLKEFLEGKFDLIS